MAQERKKRRIVLASILKPVDDTRMFDKMATSLANSGEYEVFIVGYPSSSSASVPGIQFISLTPFKRLSFRRWRAKWQVFRRVWSLKPSILIFSTHELLFPAVLLKILINTCIVYDVQENYYRNIILSGGFPRLIGWPLALLVRFQEKLLAPLIHHFFLAEKAYENEFKFHRGGWTVIENKAQVPRLPRHYDSVKIPRAIRLLFSGTLAESTGVFRAIALAKELHLLNPSISLTIIGHASLKADRERIHQEINSCPFIDLIGGDTLVPHLKILESIQNSDFGILAYPLSNHSLNSHPTKLFEYLDAQLPIILERHWLWTKTYEQYEPFAFVNFSKPDYTTLLHELETKKFYPKAPTEVSWNSEEEKLLKSLGNL